MKKSPALLPEKELLEAHHYQFDGSHPNPNECTLCSMTMLLDIGARATKQEFKLLPRELGQQLDRLPFRHPRFPAWFPGPGGATHPRAALKGMQQAIRKMRAEGKDYPWWPVLKKGQRPKDLEASLEAGEPSLIYGLGSSGIPHVVVPIARDEKGWRILDPGYPKERNPMRWTEEKLKRWWLGYYLFYPAGTMLTLEKTEYV